MSPAALEFGTSCCFDLEERATLNSFWTELASSDHPDRERLLETVAQHVERVQHLGASMDAYPSVFSEQALGRRRRDLTTLVEMLAEASDANFDMFVPTRAIVGRALLMAELNTWRLMNHVGEEVFPDQQGEPHPIREQVEQWLHGCIYTKLTEEVLSSISHDAEMDRRIRRRAVRALSHLWENRLTYRVRDFWPLLEATWEARRRIRVSVGTMLGVSEIFRLLQAGCDPEFVDFFSRPRLTQDEQEAFMEFLIGVPTEQIASLGQLMAKENKTAMSVAEAAQAMQTSGWNQKFQQPQKGVVAYEFFRERYLQAAARRLKRLPGPKRTAEEYVMIYFLDQKAPESLTD